jgi:hypothetical protein
MSIIMFEAFLSVYFLMATAPVHHGRRRKFTDFYMQHLSMYQNTSSFYIVLAEQSSELDSISECISYAYAFDEVSFKVGIMFL